MRAGGRDAAHLAIKRALQPMFPAAYQDLDEAYYNLSSALDLVREGLSERHVDRLFETAGSGEKVDAWVSATPPATSVAEALFVIDQACSFVNYFSRQGKPAPATSGELSAEAKAETAEGAD